MHPMHHTEKPAVTTLPLADVIRRRWSSVALSDATLDQQTIDTLFEAARWAPSCYNDQPWRFVYAEKGDVNRAALESLLMEGNAWAKQAGLLVIGFARKNLTRNEKPNAFHFYDLGCATGFLVLQATAMGLASHQMAGYAMDKANAALGVPDTYAPGAMIAIGHQGESSLLNDAAKQRETSPRQRNAREAIAFTTWKGKDGI